MNRLFYKVLKFNPILLGLLLTIFPFLFLFIGSLFIIFLSLIGKIGFNESLFYTSILYINLVLLVWTWTISIEVNKRIVKKKTTLFKVVFWFYLINILIFCLLNIFTISNSGIWLNNKIIKIIYFLVSIYGYIILTAYFYILIYTGHIVDLLLAKQSKKYFFQKLPSWFVILPFPLGIPILQYQIQSYLQLEKLFKINNKAKILSRKITNEKIDMAEKDKLKQEELRAEKEDPRRFMPK